MEGTDFRVAATETLVQAQSKERIAELAGVDPNAATREADSIVAAAKAKADAEAAAAASKAAAEKEEEDAALKIQAVFRGKAARRDVEELKKGGESRSARTEAAAGGGGGGAFAAGSNALHLEDTASKAVQPAPPAAQLGHWEVFAARQIARHVPLASGGLATSPAPRGYRFRVLAVEAFPFGPECVRVRDRGNALEAKVNVSFYDECTGSFHGATCSSAPEPAEIPAATPGGDVDAAPVATLDVQHDAYFTTRVCDPRCLIVTEIVLVERRRDGSIARETSAGWAAMPAVGPGGAEPTGAPGSAPVRQGSPRYLMWGRPRAGQHPPSQLGRAKLHFVHETCPALLRAAPLIPEDFPVTYGDVVPGVLRFDADGELTSDVVAVTTTLTSPLLAPTRAVSLSGMRVNLPKRMMDVVAASPDLAVALHGAGAKPPAVDSLVANPTASAAAIAAAKCVTVRITAHNGRVFVGESVEASDFAVDPEGSPSCIVLRSDAIVPDVPQDVLVVLLVEVLYRAPGKRGDPPVMLGWAATCPFRPGIESPGHKTSDTFSGGLALRIGEDALVVARRGRGPRAEPCVDWRSVVQAPQEVWRAVFRSGASGGGGDDETSVAFTFGAAEGDTGASGASQAEAARALLDAPVADNVAQAKSKMAQAETALKDTSMTGRERAKAEAALAAAKMDLSSQQQLVQVMERMQVQLNELASSVNVIKTDLRGSRDAAPAPPAAARAQPLDRSHRTSPEARNTDPEPRVPEPRAHSPPIDEPVYPDEEWPAAGPAEGSSALFSGAATDAGEPLVSARGRRSRRMSATLSGPPLRAPERRRTRRWTSSASTGISER